MNTENKIIQHAEDFMPKDPYSHKVLEMRAKQLAEKKEVLIRKNEINFIRFHLGTKEYYGIPFEKTIEVIANISLTKIPCTPSYVAGIINRRGVLLTVIDLKKMFQLPASKAENINFIIVVKNKDVSLGILVDYIEGNEKYDPEGLIKFESAINQKYIFGVHEGITTILNIEEIISDIQGLLANL